MITFELKAKDECTNMHIFQNMSSDMLIHLIKNDSTSLVNIIKKMERSLNPGGTHLYNEIIVTDPNVYI